MKPMNVLWKCALGVALVTLLGCVDARPDSSTGLAMANPLNDVELKKEWDDYKAKHGKVYNTVEEDLRRVELYLKNKKMVDEHNAKYKEGLVTFSMALNQFSDQTPEEKKHLSGTLLVPSNERQKEWSDYKKKFNKNYSGIEDQERMNLYLNNKKEVEEHNAKFEKGETTFKKGINQFSDQRPEETNYLAGVLPKPTQ